MSSYGKKTNFKKIVSYESKRNSEKIFKLNIELIHQIFNTINISFLCLIFILFFLSLDSQRKWSNTYKTLSKARAMNHNLIDYISQTEEFYISELESLITYKKTKPEDLIYFDKIAEKKESFWGENLKIFFEGVREAKYQRGY